ncbi:MAG: cell division protein FtsL [Deltaproteobacteria bacterium]|nr:cell division protein FtsL [Deltaproteobacteria bacterium]
MSSLLIRRVKSNDCVKVFIGIFIVMALLLVNVWFHTEATQLKYRMAEEMRRREFLLEEKKRFSLEIASLEAPERIEGIARLRLGMYMPSRDQVVFVK